MGAIKLTFDGANNTAKMDALLGAYLTNYQNGIIKGLGNELAYSFSNGKVTFRDGYICVYGRRVYIEDGTTVNINLDSDKYGFVVLNINTATNEVNISTVEKAGSNPNVTQTNLIKGDGLYQFVMCAYIKSASSIRENSSYSRSYVYTYTKALDDKERIFTQAMDDMYSLIDDNYTDLSSEHGMLSCYCYTSSGTKYEFSTGNVDLSKALVVVPIAGKTTVCIPGNFMSTKGSVNSIQYNIDGGTYSLLFEKSSKLILTVGSSQHKLKYIYIYY